MLIFDSSREVFILHKVDSIFNMNLIRAGNNTDANSLRREHPQLEGGTPGLDNKPAAKPAAPSRKGAAAGAKEKQEKALPMPKKPPPAKPAPPPKKVVPADDEDSDDDDDDDFGLTIENPGGEEPGARSQIMRDFSPAFGAGGRRFSEFVQQNEREASEDHGAASEQEDEDEEGEDIIGDGTGAGTVEDDADGEDEDDDDHSIEHFKLPSPMNQMAAQNGGSHHQQPTQASVPAADDEEDESDEDQGEQMVDVEEPGEDADLEAELMAALEEEHNLDQESDVSEEE